jgi:LAGLIDADG endonuclease
MIDINLTMRLSQSREKRNPRNLALDYSNSSNQVMSDISKMLHVNLVSYSRIRNHNNSTRIEEGYLIHVKSMLSRNILIEYLTLYPLQSSKKLDYLD